MIFADDLLAEVCLLGAQARLNCEAVSEAGVYAIEAFPISAGCSIAYPGEDP